MSHTVLKDNEPIEIIVDDEDLARGYLLITPVFGPDVELPIKAVPGQIITIPSPIRREKCPNPPKNG